MWAMIVKEFRQLRRDRRTLAMMIFLPILLLIIFGYAASFDVTTIRTTVVGPQARLVAAELPPKFRPVRVAPGDGHSDAVAALRDGDTEVAIVTGTGSATILIDGSQLFTANAAKAELAAMAARSAQAPANAPGPAATGAAGPTAARGAAAGAAAVPSAGFAPRVEVLFNPALKTSEIMVPGLAWPDPAVRRHGHHQPRRRPRAAGGHAGATRGHAAAPA